MDAEQLKTVLHTICEYREKACSVKSEQLKTVFSVKYDQNDSSDIKLVAC